MDEVWQILLKSDFLFKKSANQIAYIIGCHENVYKYNYVVLRKPAVFIDL